MVKDFCALPTLLWHIRFIWSQLDTLHGKCSILATRAVLCSKRSVLMAFAEVGTRYGNVILVNEGFKTSSKNINGNCCPEISQKIWRLFPSSTKTVAEKLQTLQCSESRKYSADAVSVPKWEVHGFFFFWQPPSCVGGAHTAFLKGWSEVEGVLWGDDAHQPCEKAQLALSSTLPISPHGQHCCAGSLKKCSFVLWQTLLLVKIKAQLLVK